MFRYADCRRKKEGRRIILEKKRDKKGSRSLGAYAGHVSVVYRGKRSRLSSGSNCFEGK